VAAQYGLTIEDTAAVLGIFANNGIKGGEAGTALKSVLLNLNRPTQDVQDALAKLNVHLYDGQAAGGLEGSDGDPGTGGGDRAGAAAAEAGDGGGADGGAPVKYTISTSTGAVLGGTPPSCNMIAIVRDFVFVAGNPAALSTLYWSDINNAEVWSGGQANNQQLPDGGPITGLAGGEYGLAFQENAIHRFTYVGTPLIFQRDKISSGIGCLAPGSIAQFGRMAFFLSGRGFYSIVDGELTPIGQNKIDDTFWAAYSRSDVQNNIRATIDPKRALVVWSMLDRLWIYNWVLDRWTDAYIPGLTGVATGMSAGITLDSLDATYPSGIDSIPYSLDDPIFAGGDPMITFVKSDFIIYSFGGATTLEATLQFAKTEPTPGRNSRIRRARLNSDATSGVTLTINYSSRLGDSQSTVSGTTLTTQGYMPIRASGRYIQPTVTFTSSATWTYAQGLALDMAAGGGA
jgi:hypothetical protein